MLQRFEQFSSAISGIYYAIQKLERNEMVKYGLKGPYAQYLAAMAQCPGGITAARLGQVCDKDKAAVSRAITEMEQRGLVARDCANNTSYRALLRLTPKGEQAAHYVCEKVKSAVEFAGKDLSEEHRALFYAALHQIAANLQTLSESGLPDINKQGELNMPVKIIIDSTVDLPGDLKQQVSVVPLNIHFGDEEFIDGVTITHEQFYKKLVSGGVLPRTSQPSPDAFARAYEQATADGSEAVVLTVASTLSGTHQSACIAAEDFPGVHVVDSNTVAIGTGILARLALRLAQAGLSAAEIAGRLEEEKGRVHVIAMVDTLEYLHKGGRLSRTAAIAGGLLNIKPILAIRDGQILVLGKARGVRQGFALLNKEIDAAGGMNTDKPLLLGYTGTEAHLLNKYMEDSGDLWPADVPRTIIGSVIGTHAGPGAVAAAFFKE